eukprot:TRINITY_DN2847_c0_g2_i1.p1 TRINITY_DN2847_c0_g2~~TRINITY_DN2847_c0_g2_i1.p1  ORF type:complete len:319 (+),score=70.47 TRINITY_DN2847_c0_g2_i1:94-957(+)
MHWKGFLVGLVGISVAVYMSNEGDEIGKKVDFKEAKEGVTYPRMSADNIKNPKRIWKKEDLAERGGQNANRELILSIAGEVYDVGSGEKHYAPGTGYSGFTGRDASRAFVTGEYNETAVKGLEDLTDTQIKSIMEWRQFYRDHEDYRFVGVLEGDYFTASGQPTEHLLEVNKAFERATHNENLQKDVSKQFLTCNSKHEAAKDYFELWCDDSYHKKGSTPTYMITRIKSSKEETPGRCVCATPELIEGMLAKNTEPKSETVSHFFPFPECEKGAQSCKRPKGAKPPA